MEKKKWTEKDVIKPDRIRNLDQSIFGWIDSNLLHSGFMGELSPQDFKLYGFYALAGDNLYGLSNYPLNTISTHLRMSKRDIIESRNNLTKKDLLAYHNRVMSHGKGLQHKRTLVQVLSLPIDKIIITRRRLTTDEAPTLQEGLRRHSLTTGFGRFPSETEQDQILVNVMRDDTIPFNVKDEIKRGVRNGKIRIKTR